MEQNNNPLVVVTGGGSGMGRDIALDQATLGRDVLIVGRRPDPLTETKELSSSGTTSIISVAADVSTSDGVAVLLAAIGDRPVLGVVAVAGGNTGTTQPGADIADIDAALTTALRNNLFSAVLPIEALLPQIVDQDGRIVLIGSTAGLNGAAGPYGTAKAAVAGYGRDLARRAGRRGITANTVAPGFVGDTDFFESAGLTDISEMKNAVAGQTLVGRVGQPRDITATVKWLLDPDAGWVTGQTITVNGGTDFTR